MITCEPEQVISVYKGVYTMPVAVTMDDYPGGKHVYTNIYKAQHFIHS